eukprot:4389663-Prymnesium_polylepis.1
MPPPSIPCPPSPPTPPTTPPIAPNRGCEYVIVSNIGDGVSFRLHVRLHGDARLATVLPPSPDSSGGRVVSALLGLERGVVHHQRFYDAVRKLLHASQLPRILARRLHELGGVVG